MVFLLQGLQMRLRKIQRTIQMTSLPIAFQDGGDHAARIEYERGGDPAAMGTPAVGFRTVTDGGDLLAHRIGLHDPLDVAIVVLHVA